MKEINEKGIISDDLKASIKEEMDKSTCAHDYSQSLKKLENLKNICIKHLHKNKRL